MSATMAARGQFRQFDKICCHFVLIGDTRMSCALRVSCRRPGWRAAAPRAFEDDRPSRRVQSPQQLQRSCARYCRRLILPSPASVRIRLDAMLRCGGRPHREGTMIRLTAIVIFACWACFAFAEGATRKDVQKGAAPTHDAGAVQAGFHREGRARAGDDVSAMRSFPSRATSRSHGSRPTAATPTSRSRTSIATTRPHRRDPSNCSALSRRL